MLNVASGAAPIEPKALDMSSLPAEFNGRNDEVGVEEVMRDATEGPGKLLNVKDTKKMAPYLVLAWCHGIRSFSMFLVTGSNGNGEPQWVQTHSDLLLEEQYSHAQREASLSFSSSLPVYHALRSPDVARYHQMRTKQWNGRRLRNCHGQTKSSPSSTLYFGYLNHSRDEVFAFCYYYYYYYYYNCHEYQQIPQAFPNSLILVLTNISILDYLLPPSHPLPLSCSFYVLQANHKAEYHSRWHGFLYQDLTIIDRLNLQPILDTSGWANHLPDVKPSCTPSSTSLPNPTAPPIKSNIDGDLGDIKDLNEEALGDTAVLDTIWGTGCALTVKVVSTTVSSLSIPPTMNTPTLPIRQETVKLAKKASGTRSSSAELRPVVVTLLPVSLLSTSAIGLFV
ncbi:hypothetical protein EV368DRAFT_67599 [Lentinula lateritia]|nr:hypothetical protein EV368DRAFT_67599 [Lentinula lateritia]